MDYEYYSVDPYYPLDPQRDIDTVREVLTLFSREYEIAEKTLNAIFRPRFQIGPLGARMFGRELMTRCERVEDIESTLLR